MKGRGKNKDLLRILGPKKCHDAVTTLDFLSHVSQTRSWRSRCTGNVNWYRTKMSQKKTLSVTKNTKRRHPKETANFSTVTTLAKHIGKQSKTKLKRVWPVEGTGGRSGECPGKRLIEALLKHRIQTRSSAHHGLMAGLIT